jgi:ATP-dependent DNA helicase Rep
VRLSTIHAAKGLEFPHVFVVGCEEGILPHHGDAVIDDEADAETEPGGGARVEEERRLMYVAVTRAQRSLVLSWCAARRRGRETARREPSRFLGEMALEAAPPSRTTEQADAREKLSRLRALLQKPPGAAGGGAG